MAEPKTRPTDVDPRDHIAATVDDKRRADALRLLALFAEQTGEPAAMWGPSIIGFGQYMIGEGAKAYPWPLTGFAAAKDKFALYVGARHPAIAALLPGLGKVKVGGGCVYIGKLADIDEAVLRDIIRTSAQNRSSLT